jgi:hypothetical protein
LILSPGWIGFFAFRESFALRLAILRPTLLPLGGTAGTNGESHFYKLEQGAAVVAIDERLSSGEPNVASRRRTAACLGFPKVGSSTTDRGRSG